MTRRRHPAPAPPPEREPAGGAPDGRQIRRGGPLETQEVDAFAVGGLVQVELLGAGTASATVAALEPISYHGIPGFASRVRLELPDGTVVEGIRLGRGEPWFSDPRVRLAATSGSGPRNRPREGSGRTTR